MASTTGSEARWALAAALAFAGCGEGTGASARSLEAGCAGCHPDHAAQHAASRHARAATSEVFVALRAQAQRAWQAAAFCDGCHLPAGGTEQGLGCLTCHASAGNLGRGDGALIFEPDAPVKSSFASGRAAHAVQQTGFVASADLCGTCHDVEGPGPFVESPFLHWQGSPAAERNETCKDCHLSKTPGAPDDEPGHHHRPVGLLSQAQAAQRLLEQALALELVSSAQVPGGRVITVELVSRAQGHHVPDGASFLRAIWVEARSGEWRSTPRWLSARMYAGDVEVALPTAADRAVSNALAPGARRRLSFEVPGAGPAEVCLAFRRYREDMLRALGLPPALAGPKVSVRCLEVS